MRTRGNERRTETYAVAGQDERAVADAAREYGPAVDQRDGDLEDLTYAAGRTISLGNYEFVRIQIGVRAGFAPGVDREAAFDTLQAWVAGVLGREEALVRQKAAPEQPLPALEGAQRLLWVEYGLTLNGKARFESHKVDLGVSRPLGDGEDAGAALEELQAYLSQRIDIEKSRVRGA